MDKNEQSEWVPEGFPQPRTFPDGWDGLALMNTNGHYSEGKEKALGDEHASSIDWHPEKFPQPRTYPQNWSIDD